MIKELDTLKTDIGWVKLLRERRGSVAYAVRTAEGEYLVSLTHSDGAGGMECRTATVPDESSASQWLSREFAS